MRKIQSKQLNKNEIITFLRKNKPYLKKHFGVTKIALFGSYAREEQTKKSDIDILIEMKIHDFDTRYDLKDFLEQKFNKNVQILYFSGVRKFIMDSIKEDIIHA